MHTQTLAHRPLLTQPLDRAPKPDANSLATPAEPSIPGLARIGAILAAATALLFCVGFFAGWIGLAVFGIFLAIAAGSMLLFQNIQTSRNLLELQRFVSSMNQGGNPGITAFTFTRTWKTIAETILNSHGLLLQQLRERQSVAQKLELSQSLVQAAQRRAEAIVDCLSDAVVVTNMFGELLLANPEAERLFGFQLEQVRGKSVRQVVATSAMANLIEQVAHRGSGTQRHTEELTITSDGKPRWYKATAGAVVDSTTEHLGIVTVLRDITSEKAAQARSAEFVSAVSHEIKTPLASVKAYAEMLADGDADGDPETQQKFLNIIEVQTDRMTRLLESMLDIARIESGVVRVEKKVISLNELIEGGAKLMAPAATDKNISIETRLSSLYLGVSADSDMLSRVVMNLVSNAIKYTDRGGRITLRSQILDDQAAFEVEDTGHGIPVDAMPKLFQKFYRVKENSNLAPGTGLGLSLVKHIVEEVHGGKIEVQSETGKGSIFRVRLPLERLN